MKIKKFISFFPNGICTKVNVIAHLEFELVHCDVADNHASHYATRSPLMSIFINPLIVRGI